MEAVPGLAMSAAETDAVNCVALTKLVGSAEPFHCTTVPATKFAPLTVRVNAGPPALTVAGLTEVIFGAAASVRVTAMRAPVVPPLPVTVIAS